MNFVKMTKDPNAGMILEAQTSIEAMPEYDFPGLTIYFEGFIPGYDLENDTLLASADAGDLTISVTIGNTVKRFALDENGEWAEVV